MPFNRQPESTTPAFITICPMTAHQDNAGATLNESLDRRDGEPATRGRSMLNRSEQTGRDGFNAA